MARPKTIEDETILDAAREVFIKEGFAATTATVAQRAGISEGSIFRRFPTKQHLFIAAMGLPHPTFFDAMESDEIDDFWEQLSYIAEEMILFFIEIIPKVMMLHTTFTDSKITKDAPPIVAAQKLSAFFKRHQKESPVFSEPEVSARIFLGALHHYAFANVMGFDEIIPTPRDAYIHHLLRMLGAPEDTP